MGLYALDAYSINPESSTFYMTGYLWLRWSGPIDPVDSLEFVNAVDESDLTVKVSTDEPRLLASGEKVQDLKFQGRFYEPFKMTREQVEMWKETMSRLWPKVERVSHQFVKKEIAFECEGETP